MNSPQIEKLDDTTFRLNGELNMYSVPQMLNAISAPLSTGPGELCIDLGGVSRSDSAGLALLVEWMRQAKERQVKLRFRNLPLQLREIARISDLLSLLPLD